MDGGNDKLFFQTAEDAWFWFIRCQVARWQGARDESTWKLSERPCGPDDIYRWACELYNDRTIGPAHLEIMSEYGFLYRVPDRYRDEEIVDALLWDEGMKALEALLTEKGMLAL